MHIPNLCIYVCAFLLFLLDVSCNVLNCINACRLKDSLGCSKESTVNNDAAMPKGVQFSDLVWG